MDAKLSPHSIEAEQAVLGSLLINPQAIAEVSSLLQASDFFLVKHGWVWEALTAIAERGEDIDIITVSKELQSRGRIDDVGGAAYILELSNITPTHIHLETYANIVKRCAVRRRLLAAASDIAQAALQEDAELSDVIERATTKLKEAASTGMLDKTKSMTDVATDVYDAVVYLNEHPTSSKDLTTGFPTLDTKLGGGFQQSDLVVIAARPGMGKTSLAMNMAVNCAKAGLPIGIYSLEMSPERLLARMLSAEANFNSRRLRAGNLNEREWTQLTNAYQSISGLPIHFNSSQSVALRDIEHGARLLKRKYGIKALAIDYLQLMVTGDPKYETIMIGRITRALKLLAGELRIPIWLLSQLNRELERRPNKRPMLADLRQSGNIEQDADTVIFIYRDCMYNPQAATDVAEFDVAKQRDGDTGTVPMRYSSHITKFYEPEPPVMLPRASVATQYGVRRPVSTVPGFGDADNDE